MLKNLFLNGKNMKLKNKIYLFPFTLLVIFFASFIIILSPSSQKKTIFKISPTPSVSYSCPLSEWIDCMPGPGPVKTQCQPDYLNWIKVNCKNFQGVAY